MLVTDESGSMSATDVDPSRLEAARSAAKSFLDRVPDKLLVGFVGFSSRPTRRRADARPHAGQVRPRRPAARRRHRDRRRARRGARPPGRAPRQGRQARARRGHPALRRQAHAGQRPARGGAARQAARHPGLDRRARHRRRRGLRAAGPDARRPARPRHAAEISSITGGTFTETADAGELDKVYKRLGSKVGTKRVKQEVSSDLRRRRPAPAARRARHRPALGA